jgi:hypothetical protein
MRIICLLLLAAVISCNKPASTVNTARMNQLADRSCRAMSIRQQRYALADKIRFAQDTIGTTNDEKVKGRLQNSLKGYLVQKDSLLKVSLTLADTIHRQLDSLMPYTDKAAQKRFTAQLDSLLAKRGCKPPGKQDSISK